MKEYGRVSKPFLGFYVLLIASTVLLDSIQIANASNIAEAENFTLPEGRILQRTIHNQAAFEALKVGKETYKIIRNGKLITFGSTLDLISSTDIINVNVWSLGQNGEPNGLTDCKNLAFGLDECKSITNLKSGKSLYASPLGQHIDPHELQTDSQGNFWYLSYPKYECDGLNPTCLKFGVTQGKIFADCQVNQVSPEGVKLFSWNASEHIPPTMIIKSYIPEGPRKNYLDFFHCNSIDVVNPEKFIISSRNTDAIYQINKNTSEVMWKLGGHWWPGVSLRAQNFKRAVGKETIAQHDARYLGNGLYSYFDNESHANKPARGVVFRVTETGNTRTAKMLTEFANPYGNSSLCTGSFRKSSENTYVAGWGCSPNGITLFTKNGLPVVSLNFIETDVTKKLYSDAPLLLNHVDWGPSINYALSYRVAYTP